MAHKHGLIEIRLDRRQAFYALIGSLLIVSVAFVVGLIVGQRMQLTGPETPELSVTNSEMAAGSTPDSTTGDESQGQEEEPHYTFYDELAAAPPRPLLNPTPTPPTPPAEPIGEPVAAVRNLPRETPENAAAEGAAREETRQQPPAPQPEVATAPTEPREEPVRLESRRPAVAPIDSPSAEREEDAEAPRLQRRVRRVATDEESGSGPEEFGYYTVEVGRFGSFAEANEQSLRLRDAGHDAIVTIIAAEGEARQYRVQVGSFTRRTEADRTADSISGLGMRARVVQEG